MQFPGKLTNQTSQNDEEHNFGPNFVPFDQFGPQNSFLWILPLLVARHCLKLSSYAI